jgi:putative DNA primase/helicase
VIFKEFEIEFPGILNWAIEGYRKYQDEGVEEPKVVLDAIKEYRSDSDTLGRFMEECCTTSDSSVSTKDLYKAYESWCLSNSEYKQHQQQSSLTLELKRKGFNLRTGGGRKTLLDGYQLIEEEENPIFKPVEELEFEEEEDDF